MEDGNSATLRQHEAEEAAWGARLDKAEQYRDILVDGYIEDDDHKHDMHDYLADLGSNDPNFLAAIRNLCVALPRSGSRAKPNTDAAINAAAEIVALVRWQINKHEGDDLVREYAEAGQ